ncbi:hypothetical protein PchlO6_5631 [Pseudomonas chlororaphis O6]|uniref:Uncharacterized protein n=1 Tax=Pseudomonas chlororaphis O6 TaxID=1037915 RepID=A0AB33WUH2_9PSED|nr:hypothetical protein PchlO6_5631 [Pseudomonas chlororaphis O6]
MAQQSLVTSLISRGVTCDADNLSDYQSDPTSTHTNCLIQLLKSGWLSLSSQPRRAFYSSLCICQAVILRSFQSFLCNFNHLRFRSLVSGRRILQRYTLLSTPLFLRFRPRRSNRQSGENTLPNRLLRTSMN